MAPNGKVLAIDLQSSSGSMIWKYVFVRSVILRRVEMDITTKPIAKAN